MTLTLAEGSTSSDGFLMRSWGDASLDTEARDRWSHQVSKVFRYSKERSWLKDLEELIKLFLSG